MNITDPTVHSMDCDMAERHLATGCSDGVIRLYALKDKQVEKLVDLSGHSGPITKVAFCGQGEILVSADFRGVLCLWKLENGVFVKKIEKSTTNGPVYDLAVRRGEDGIKIFCGCDGGILKTYTIDAQMNCEEASEEVHRYGVLSVSCNDDCVATSGFDMAVGLHTKDGVQHFKEHKAAVNVVALAPSNHLSVTALASGSEDGMLVIRHGELGKLSVQSIALEKPITSLVWDRIGLVLTVGFGEDQVKSYILGETGEYEEVEMSPVDK